MGFRERFLTAGVAVPLSLWFIAYDAWLCLSLVLVLQAISVHELSRLLHRTRRVLETRAAAEQQGRATRPCCSLFSSPFYRRPCHVELQGLIQRFPAHCCCVEQRQPRRENTPSCPELAFASTSLPYPQSTRKWSVVQCQKVQIKTNQQSRIA